MAGCTKETPPPTPPDDPAVTVPEEDAEISPTIDHSDTRRAAEFSPIVIAPEDLTFSIARDYNQRVELELRNQTKQPKTIVATVDPWGHGLLGDFVGPGSLDDPVEVAPGGRATVSLYLFAQDATRRHYRSRIAVKDAQTQESLATTPITVLVPTPAFDLAAQVGQADAGTLAVPITVTNNGGPLTDVTVVPGKELQGRVFFNPRVEHANLPSGKQLQFKVYPHLHTRFEGLEGSLVVRAAGQETAVPVAFQLPEGKRVFVATSFSTGSYDSRAGYCTNCPSNDAPIGGPSSDWSRGDWINVYHPSDQDNPLAPGRGKPGHWATVITVGDLPVGAIIWDSPSGDNWWDGTIQFFPNGLKTGPRGLRVRPAYEAYRREIYDDNYPEAWSAESREDPSKRVILQTWHSNRRTGAKGREVLFRAWEGFDKPLQAGVEVVNEAGTYGQWPTVLALPQRRALVVWEQASSDNAAPRLFYRISGPGFANWSDPAPVSSDETPGDYDPVAVLGPDGNVTLVWQRGADGDAQVMIARGTAGGAFEEPAAPSTLPAGASRPIIRVAPDGTLYLVFQATGKVYVASSRDGGKTFESITPLSPADVDAGEPDLVVHGDTIHVAFRAGESWQSQILHTSRALSGGDWTPPIAVTNESQYAEFPSLSIHRDGGLLVDFYGDARPDSPPQPNQIPDKTIIKRWRRVLSEREPRRLLTGFPAVGGCWLQVNFELRSNRAAYRPHEIRLLLNDYEILHGKDVVPEGTYLVPVPPSVLRRDENGLPQNVIGLRTQHMNSGHYWSATGFRLQARHRFIEQLVVAETQQEADALLAAETEVVNHARPDVGLFASFQGDPPPAAPEIGQPIGLNLILANLGESPAEQVTIEVFDQPPGAAEPILEANSAGHLPELDFREISVEFPFTGKGRYFVVARSVGEDFDPSNNVHTVSFVVPQPPATPPLKPNLDQVITVTATDDPDPIHLVRLLEESTGREVARLERGRLLGEVPSGRYQFAVTRFDGQGKEVLYPQAVEYIEGEPLHVQLQSGIELSLPENLVATWAVTAKEKPDEILQWHRGGHPVMLLPPGDYQLTLAPTHSEHDAGELRWPATITVKPDDLTTVNLDCGIRLEVPQQAGSVYLWQVVAAGKPGQVVQWQKGDNRMMLLPPGEYQVAFRPTSSEHDSGRLVWPALVSVKAGEFTSLVLDSGILLDIPEAAGSIHLWQVVPVGKPKEVVQWQKGNNRRMIVPPGDYQVLFRPEWSEHASGQLLWPETIHVEPHRMTPFRLGSGITLDLPEGAEPPRRWAAYRGEELIQWYSSKLREMLLPPGEYRVASIHDKHPFFWPGEVLVEPGKLTPVRLRSGIRLVGPPGAKPELDVRVIDQANQTLIYGRGTWSPLAIPPGTYRVEIRASAFTRWQLLTEAVEVTSGEIREIRLESLP